MSAVEAGRGAVRATSFHNEPHSLLPTALGGPIAKLLGAGYLVKKTSIRRRRERRAQKGHLMTKRTAMRPAIATYVVTCLPLESPVRRQHLACLR